MNNVYTHVSPRLWVSEGHELWPLVIPYVVTELFPAPPAQINPILAIPTEESVLHSLFTLSGAALPII